MPTYDRRHVFVRTSPDCFNPRVVTVGERTGYRIAILEGLADGERPASSGNFCPASAQVRHDYGPATS